MSAGCISATRSGCTETLAEGIDSGRFGRPTWGDGEAARYELLPFGPAAMPARHGDAFQIRHWLKQRHDRVTDRTSRPREREMKYQITGKQIDVGTALQTHVETELGAVAEKYAGRPTDANVVFSRDGNAFAAEATIHLSTGLLAQAQRQRPRDLRRLRQVRRQARQSSCAATSGG